MLKNKTVFITGSSRGIGAATARAAKKYGARVLLHGLSKSDGLVALAEELDSPYVTFDVADEEAVESELVFENIDVLVNNAGINPSKTFHELSNEDWHRIFEVNLFGAMNVSRVVLEGMKKRGGGSIVNVASIKGFLHVPGKPGYATSKAALIQLTARMAEEFAPYGIRVNTVAPGFTATEMTQATVDQPAIQAQIGKIPLGRMATPEEIAQAVLFLAGSQANYITGQCLAVDGGLSIV